MMSVSLGDSEEPGEPELTPPQGLTRKFFQKVFADWLDLPAESYGKTAHRPLSFGGGGVMAAFGLSLRDSFCKVEDTKQPRGGNEEPVKSF